MARQDRRRIRMPRRTQHGPEILARHVEPAFADLESRCATLEDRMQPAGAPARSAVPPSTRQPESGNLHAGSALAVLFAINLLNFYDRQTLGPLAEPIRKEFHLTDTQLGLLGTMFTILYAMVGLPFGRLADSWSRKKLLALGMLVWSTLTAGAALVTSFGMLAATRLGGGAGEATGAPAGTSWIGGLFPAHKRSPALPFFILAVAMGSSLTY